MIFVFEQTAKDAMIQLGVEKDEVIKNIRLGYSDKELKDIKGDEILSFMSNGKLAVAVVNVGKGMIIVHSIITNVIKS